MFNYEKLKELKENLKKQAFVPIDSKSAQAAPPDAGAGASPMDPGAGAPPPDAGAGAPPMDPSMMGGDPSMMGGGMPPPMDPSMMGGDPSMMGLPPPPAGGGAAVGPNGESMITMTVPEFLKFLKQMMAIAGKGGGDQQTQGVQPQPQMDDQAQLAEVNAKLDAILHG